MDSIAPMKYSQWLMQIAKDMIMDWGVMESASSINSNFVHPQATLKKSGLLTEVQFC